MSDDVFRWVIAGAVVLACVAFSLQAGMFIALYRIAKNVQNIAKNLQNKVVPLADRAEPILDTTRRIVSENRPRISEISTDAAAVVKTAREQADRISALLADATDRAQARIIQFDRSVDEAVDQFGNFGDALRSVFAKSVREVNGIVSGVKAAVATYAHGGRRPSVEHATQDEEMFI